MALRAVACAVALASCAVSQSCTYPVSMNGRECWGLQQATGAVTPAACEAACCAAGPSCETWQFCPVGGSCPTPGSCWIGPLGSDCHAVADWVGGATASLPVPPSVVNLTGVWPLPPPVPLPGWGNATTPTGRNITVDSVSYRLDGEPWLQVMGEFQFSRTPAAEWADVLARMRASGVTVVGSYVFWLRGLIRLGGAARSLDPARPPPPLPSPPQTTRRCKACGTGAASAT